jgi:hypothetical protein
MYSQPNTITHPFLRIASTLCFFKPFISEVIHVSNIWENIVKQGCAI